MKHLYRIIFLLILTNNLNAQNDEGEIEDAQILIEKNSRIILQKSDKSVDKIDLEVNNFKKFKTSFEIINFQFGNDTRKIDRKPINDIKLENDYPTELKILGGNYKSYLFQFNPHLKFDDKLFIYSNFFLKSNSKGSLNNDLSKEKLYDNNLSIYYKLNNYNLITSNFSLISSSNGFYGFSTKYEISDDLKSDLRSIKNNYNYNISWLGYKKDLNYGLLFSGSHLRDNSFIDISENEIDVKGNISLKYKKINLSFDPIINYYQLGNHSSIKSENIYPLDFRKIEIPISIKYYAKNLSIGIASRYLSLKKELKKSETFNGFYGKLDLSYSKNNISFYVSAENDLFYERYSDIIGYFPYLYDPTIFDKIHTTDINYKIDANFSYEFNGQNTLSFNYQIIDTKGSLDYAHYFGDKRPSELNFPIYLYSMSRNDKQEYISTFKLVGDFTLSDRINSSLHFTYNNYENIEVFIPIYESGLSSTYKKDKFKIQLGLDMLFENHGLNFSNETFKMNNIINLNLSSSYELNDNINIHLNIDNMLNNYNELFFMYPKLGANVMSGLTWKF